MCFVTELFLVAPPFGQVMKGFIPTIDPKSVYAAVGILGVCSKRKRINGKLNNLFSGHGHAAQLFLALFYRAVKRYYACKQNIKKYIFFS